MVRLLGACLAFLIGCRGTPRPPAGQSEDIARLVDSLRPAVERATGLQFRGPTRSALKSREEIREYLVTRLREDFPPDREQGIQAVYRLLGLIPDSLDLKSLLLDLYTEQVAGFYDPGTSTLYGVRGADPTQLRLVLAHELVHALQHQYLPLDSIMKSKGNADQQAAAQAVFEGQATIASIKVLLPGQDLLGQPGFWQSFREQIKAQQSSMQVFGRAPLALREELIFPYLSGSEFMRWWDSTRSPLTGHGSPVTGHRSPVTALQPLPTVATMPRSTEQILHPVHYGAGDAPLRVSFADSTADLQYEDTLGELEIQVLATVLRGGGEVLTDTPIGWGGDRFRIYRTAAGPALVWYTQWDDSVSAARFRGGVGARLAARARAGYRTTIESLPGQRHPTIRVVIAPLAWTQWSKLPRLANSQ